MMTYDEIKELYDKELNTIYTSEELKFHQKERMLKSWFEITHAHNYDLIDLIDATNDYLFNGAPKPQRKLWVMLRPGNNNENAVCARIQSINNYFAKYEHGETPLLPIIAYASKSTRTLITKLDEFHFHKSISDLDHYVKEYFCLVAYQGEPMMNRDEFANKLNELSNAFISSMTEYARDLCEWTHKCEADLKHGEKTIKVEIVNDIPTKSDLNRTKREIIKSTTTNRKSAIDKSGPSSSVRKKQINAVMALMIKSRSENHHLTLHKVCEKVWTPLKGGYPSCKALYEYCHSNKDQF